MKKIMIAMSMVLACLPLTATAAKTDRIGLVEQPVPVSAVRNIGGFVGERMVLNREVYLKQFPIDEYVDFVVNRQHRDWIWTKAEQHGKWIESAYLSAIQSGDEELLEKAQRELYRIIDSQEPEGYLGATARDYRSAERPIRGMDPYELYFVFHALTTVYEETGDTRALHSAERLANYFLKYFGQGKQEFWPSKLRWPKNVRKQLSGTSDFAGHSVHYSWEGTLLCDPMARLYEVTGKKKYLDWAQWVVSGIDRWSGWNSFSRLDSVADGTLTVDKLQPYVHSHTFHMNFMGFLRLYRITGNKSLLRKVEGAWDDIYRRQMYITGGVSVAEHYEHGYVKPLSGNIVESCATMSWMQLSQMLLQLTGDTKYADAMERLMINHVFAAQDAETGSCRYHTAPNGMKPDGYFHGPDCCTASGHRIISLLPTFFYAERGRDFYINQYIDAEYDGKDFGFRVTGNYPEGETVTITVTKGANKTLHLRLPSWCDQPKVSVNGETFEGKSGYVTINRKWKQGDIITVHLPMKEQWVMREHHSNYPSYNLPGGEIMYREEPTNRIPYAFLRGPVVYCLDMVWNPQLSNDDVDIARDIKIDVTKLPVKIVNSKWSNHKLICSAYQAEADYMGRKVTLILTPFAGIGQWWREGEQKPTRGSRAFSYAIWMNK